MKQGDTKNSLSQLSRLHWACRRGMLELDVLLGNFLQEAYPQLSLQKKQVFTRLLSCTDPDLFSWLMGHEVPADVEFAHLSELIRHHAQSRFATKAL